MDDSKKFDPRKLEKLNNPERLKTMSPDLIWQKLALKDPRVLVDIGAGTGFFAVPFSRKMPGGKVYACDISDIMVRWMNENLPTDVRGVVEPLMMEETKVPLDSGIADLVYMINLHHELESPAAIMSESLRLLKKGGKLMIIDWKKEETPEGPPLEIRVTRDAIISDMGAAGFRNITSHAVLQYNHFVVGER